MPDGRVLSATLSQILALAVAACATAGGGTSPAGSAGADAAADGPASRDSAAVRNLLYGTPGGAWRSTFELSSRPETVVIGGSVVPRESRQDELYRRYRWLEPDLPPAYRLPSDRGGGR